MIVVHILSSLRIYLMIAFLDSDSNSQLPPTLLEITGDAKVLIAELALLDREIAEKREYNRSRREAFLLGTMRVQVTEGERATMSFYKSDGDRDITKKIFFFAGLSNKVFEEPTQVASEQENDELSVRPSN